VRLPSSRVSTIARLDYWTGLLDSPKLQNTPRSVQNMKLNVLTHSVTSHANTGPYSVFSGVSRGQRSHAYLISFNDEFQL